MTIELALSALTIATILVAVLLIVLTVQIAAMARDLRALFRVTAQLNQALNPFGDEPTAALALERQRWWGSFPTFRAPKPPPP
jgi:hypothetical protein